MIAIRRAADRGHSVRHGAEVWCAFRPEDPTDAFCRGFGVLQSLDECWLEPGATASTHGEREGERVTYVREGSLTYSDALGHAGTLHAGEFLLTNVGGNTSHEERNPSVAAPAHIFQLTFLSTDGGGDPRVGKKRFSTADRRGVPA